MELADKYRFQHRYILGKTGVGKSTTMLRLMLADIERGDGVFYVDPHGHDADRLLEHIPRKRLSDVVLFDPSNIEHPAPLNIFENVAPEWRAFVASSIVDMFKSVWGYDRIATPVMDQYLYNSSAALLEAPQGTLAGMKFILTSERYRDAVLAHVTDPFILDFWKGDFARLSEREKRETASSTLNKIGMLLADPRIRNTIAYPKSAFDLDAIIRGKILIARLPQGRLGLQKTATLGAILLARVHAACLARTDDKPFHIYLDECHHFGTSTLVEMLSGIRKFNVSLTLCHQYINQLPTPLRDAVLGSVGTKIVFRVGLADAEALRHELPVTGIEYSVAETPPFAARVSTPVGELTLEPSPPLPEPIDDTIADRIRAFSQRHHTRSRRKVERCIVAMLNSAS